MEWNDERKLKALIEGFAGSSINYLITHIRGAMMGYEEAVRYLRENIREITYYEARNKQQQQGHLHINSTSLDSLYTTGGDDVA